MLTHSSTYNLSIATGNSVAIPTGAENYNFLVTGSRNFSGSAFQITMSGTPATNTTRMFIFDVTATNYDVAGGDHLTLLGTQVPQSLLGATGTFTAIAHYNGSTWRVLFQPSWGEAGIVSNNELGLNSVESTNIVNGEVSTLDVADEAITLAKLEHLNQYEFLGRATGGAGDVEKLNPAAVRTGLAQKIALSGEVTATSTTENPATGVTTVTTTIGNGVVEVVNCDNTVNRALVTGMLSFENNETGYTAIKMPFKCEVEDFACVVIHPIGNSGDGSITLLNHAGNIMGTVSDPNPVTITAATAVAASVGGIAAATFNIENINSNNSINTSERIIFLTSKAGTAGGKVMFSMRVKKVV